MKVVFDPGHGGKDPGAVSPQGLKEKDVVLKLGKMLHGFFLSGVGRAFGIDSKITRSTDVFVELAERAQISNSANANLFISLHCNSFDKKEPKGLEVYHYPGSVLGEKAASIIYREMQDQLKMTDRGVKTDTFTVLQKTRCPAILIELGFLSNPEEEKKLADDKWLELAATSIFIGCLKYKLQK